MAAYFSMEIGVDPVVATYAGGLGVLAGDLVRAAAEFKLPLVGVTLLHRKAVLPPSVPSISDRQSRKIPTRRGKTRSQDALSDSETPAMREY